MYLLNVGLGELGTWYRCWKVSAVKPIFIEYLSLPIWGEVQVAGSVRSGGLLTKLLVCLLVLL